MVAESATAELESLRAEVAALRRRLALTERCYETFVCEPWFPLHPNWLRRAASCDAPCCVCGVTRHVAGVDYEIFAIATEETPSGSRTPDHPLGICDSCTDHWIQAGTLLRDVDAGRDYHVRNVVICPRDSDTE